MANHEWTVSNLGHGESMCKNCGITNREAAVLGRLNFCDAVFTKTVTGNTDREISRVECERTEDPALTYAQSLARVLYQKHYKKHDTSFQVSDNLMDVLMQIDNMTTGMIRDENGKESSDERACRRIREALEEAYFNSRTVIDPSLVEMVIDAVKPIIDEYVSALQWCSVASDFQEDGRARVGWDKLCRHLI